MSQLHAIAAQFAAGFASSGQAATAPVVTVEPLGNGNINTTYLVTISPSPASVSAKAAEPGQSGQRFVLQRINTDIFRQPELVVQNMTVLSEHLERHTGDLPRRWETPRILPTNSGDSFVVDESGGYWRAITFIENAQVFDTVKSPDHAREVGYGLAMFHTLLSTLPADSLADTLQGFHITPGYLAEYEQTLKSLPSSSRQPDIQHCLDFIEQRKAWAHVLENAKAAGELQLRPIHGDPKVNNIMLGPNGQAVSLIDLDTVKPGLVHYDIGDCLRSGCNPLGEETQNWRSVEFDTQLAKAMLEGYLTLASDFLTKQDYHYLYDAIRLIAFELGLRFFSDYLAGSVYFNVKHPEHNLDRALVQFQLTASIEKQEAELKALIESLNPSSDQTP
ncbi:MAG: aminoglycoside phosphotransferase family protein [Cyanobacteria bacterium J06621_3]